jgi:hypothetical protein
MIKIASDRIKFSSSFSWYWRKNLRLCECDQIKSLEFASNFLDLFNEYSRNQPAKTFFKIWPF